MFVILFLASKTKHKVLQQDGVFKYFQLEDFLLKEGWDFSALEVTDEIDPEGKFSRFKPPFQYKIGEKKFFVFPYAWTVLNYLQYKYLGFYGLFLVPFLGGILSLYFFYKLLKAFDVHENILSYSLLFYIFCTPLLIYSNWYYEATLCSFLLYFSMWAIFQRKNLYTFLAGLSLGSIFFLRSEILIFAYLFLGFLFFANSVYRRQILLVGILSFSIVLFSFYLNKLVYGTYSPLRSLDMANYDIEDRVLALLKYLVLEHYSIFIYSPFLYLSFWIVKEKYRSKKSFLLEEISLFLASWLFIFFLPLLAPNQQGIDFTPRYFFPVIPILGYLSFRVLEIKNFFNKNWLAYLVIFYSFLFILAMSFLVVYSNKLVDRHIELILKESKNFNILVHNFPNYTYLTDRKIKYFRIDNGQELHKLISFFQEKKIQEEIVLFKLRDSALDWKHLPFQKVNQDAGLEVFKLSLSEQAKSYNGK